MSASNHPKADFTRTCATCKHAVIGPIAMRCTAAKHLVTGAALPMDCLSARASKGHCGPAGKHWEAIERPLPTTGRLPHTKRNGEAVQ